MPFNEVKAKVLNLEFYQYWWNSFDAVVNTSSKTMKFSPMPFVKIELELNYIDETKIEFFYIKGPFKGLGCWEIHPIDNNQTKVSYTINLQGFWYSNFILKTVFFKWKHKKDIINLIKLLDKIQ